MLYLHYVSDNGTNATKVESKEDGNELIDRFVDNGIPVYSHWYTVVPIEHLFGWYFMCEDVLIRKYKDWRYK